MVGMNLTLPENVNYVTVLVLPVSIMTPCIVMDVTLVNTYIITFVTVHVHSVLILLNNQPKLVRIVTKDVLSVLTKLTNIVLNVTIHGS